MNIAFDTAGRLWVTGSTLYPWPARRDAAGDPISTFKKNWEDNPVAFRAAASPPPPPEDGLDTIRVLSDFDPATGRAREVTTFADGLNIPIGLMPLPRVPGARGDSVIVFSIPSIWRLTDTDGDGRADLREKLYDGFGFRDTHGMSSNYCLWLDGWIYGTHGFSNVSEVIDRRGRVVKISSGSSYRFRPDGSRFEVVSIGQTNPFGLAFDSRGDLYTADSHSKPVYLIIPGGYYEGLARAHDGLGFAPPITLDDHGSSAIAGVANYAAKQFPAEFRGNLFNGNPVTRRINRDRLDWRGSSPNAQREPDFLTTDDRAFRPIQVKLGPDGALWIADFYNPIIGHYEVPLTDPARDHGHGRIWRIVWRGMEGGATPAVPPNLTTLDEASLVTRLSDSNLTVRSLAVTELLARPAAANAVPALRRAVQQLIAGSSAIDDETTALPLLVALERLGQCDDSLLASALQRPGSDVALAALRVWGMRETLPANAASIFETLEANSAPGYNWRAIAQVLFRLPQPWGGPLLLRMLEKSPEADFELNYALRLALKVHATTADAATLEKWATDDSAADHLAAVCLAVPTPAAADFLLSYLERTKFSVTRAGEFARQAVANLPAEQFDAVLPLIRSLAGAPRSQRLSLAEGLAMVAAKPGRNLPSEADTWLHKELTTAIDDPDVVVALRAVKAITPLNWPEKAAPLRRMALTLTIDDPTRVAALRALAPGISSTESALIDVLNSKSSTAVRRVAADLLGTANANLAVRESLAKAFIGAPSDMAVVVATSLARSDAGATQLVELASAGMFNPALLRQRYVAAAIEKRSSDIRARVEKLTQNLPAEDARLDAVIAQRLAASSKYQPDAKRGALVFAAQCAACHRLHDQGGTIGPSLDGISSRSTARLIEDILDPNRNIDPAFQLTTITRRNGETNTGMNLREEGGELLLTIPGTAQTIAVAKADVAETSRSPLSPMPASFETAIAEKDFFDLLEYLHSPTVK
ncbi:MAG: c-type cytochrome [Opitutus sp.]